MLRQQIKTHSTHKLESDALEQYGRRNILRISGIPETDREDNDDFVLRVASDLGVPMSPREIDRSHRVGKVHTGRGPKPNRKHRDIIVIWFDFCLTALRHILGHFGCGQLPSHTVPGQAS